MNNEYMKYQLEELKKSMKLDIEQVAKYQALTVTLNQAISDKEDFIKIIEATLNPEKRNDTLAKILRA